MHTFFVNKIYLERVPHLMSLASSIALKQKKEIINLIFNVKQFSENLVLPFDQPEAWSALLRPPLHENRKKTFINVFLSQYIGNDHSKNIVKSGPNQL